MLDPKNCKPGQEQYESFYSRIAKKELVQYDYRNKRGRLFSCTARSLEQARAKRDAWIARVEMEA